MIDTSATAAGAAARLPAEENDLSRRYLRLLERWVPTGVELFAPWPERPDCGHFLGGCHWYGLETVGPALAFALAATSPEYDAGRTGVAREDLRRMAIQGVRYLCFTHDTGPAECVRPSTGLGRPENCGTKWGERGKGFFRESQCGTVVATMGLICLLLREQVDAETWAMVARIHEDYGERFGELPPRSGVYWDTQMEENYWTAHGLNGAALFLALAGDPAQRERAAAWQRMARRWMFSTCAAPQDAKDLGSVGDATAKALAGKTFTALPDYWAENHGMVHPNYTGAGMRGLMTDGCLYRLHGHDLPPELFWNRRRLYENLKALTDLNGYVQPVQGMDWHYLPAMGDEALHAIGAVFFDDPDAAALQRLALRRVELRQEGNGGRLYDRDFAARAHDVQDPMIMREAYIARAAEIYLLHRLFGPGAAPAPVEALERRLRGVRVFPHAGVAYHRHANGQTSFSWRNSIMALPLTRDGIFTVAPAADSWLGQPRVAGKPDSHRQRSARVREYDAGFAAALVVDRCQESLRQQVLFASLPDGRVLSYERFVALEDLTLEALDQGFLRITNESFPLLGPACRGQRVLYRPDGSTEYRGWLGDDAGDDVADVLDHPAWLNVDDRLGIRFAGTGRTVYHNRHYFRPYRAIADDLTLSRLGGEGGGNGGDGADGRDERGHESGQRTVRAGEVAGVLAALLCPEQPHAATAAAAFAQWPEVEASSGADGADRVGGADGAAGADGTGLAVCLVTDGYAAVANFGAARRRCTFEAPRPAAIPIYEGATVEVSGDRLRLTVTLEAASAGWLAQRGTLEPGGTDERDSENGRDVRVSATAEGEVYVTDLRSGAVRRA